MAHPVALIACHGCDLLLEKPKIATGKILFCPRCKSQLYHKKVDSISKTLAISSAGLLAYLPAVFFPLLSLEVAGITQNGSIFDTFLSFYHQNFYFVAGIVFLTTIFFPLLKLSLLFSVSLQLTTRLYSRHLPFLFRAANRMDEWGMPDVYLLAILVSIIKISSVGSINYSVGFGCFLFLTLMTHASVSALEPEQFWLLIEEMQPSIHGRISHD